MAQFQYTMYILDTSNGAVVANIGLQTLIETPDAQLSDAVGGNADGFTAGASSFKFRGGFATDPAGLANAGDFVAQSGNNWYFFSSNPNIPIGFDVDAQPDFVGKIANQPRQGTVADGNNLSINLTCFLPGTMIRTDAGDVAVEELAIGQKLVTADGRTLPVKWIGRQSVAWLFSDKMKTAPVCIKAGALGENVPSRDLYTSAGHSMFIDGILAVSGALVNGSSVVRVTPETPVITYYHVELDEHAVIFANDAPTESFVDNVSREVFDNAAEHAALYPDAQPIAEMDVPVAKSARQLPAAVKAKLAERAALLSGTQIAA